MDVDRPDAASPRDESTTPRAPEAVPERVYGPAASGVIGTLITAVLCAGVLEFLVITSFLGQHLWADPRLGRDFIVTLPLLIWFLVLVATLAWALRTLTIWLQVDEHGFRLRGLCRRTRAADWTDVGRVVAIRDIRRPGTAAELLDSGSMFDALELLREDGTRLAVVSGRVFGPRAQLETLRRARGADVPIEQIETVTVEELRRTHRDWVSPAEVHPNLVLAGPVLFYLAHNALTFAIWGL
ncbi:hypothetical protein DEO23_03475 [Brachybacterium endophyticum]|uniref:PH domain-containing protein n=1 Tax=Brachybacterium endophyticum TaxID=2182385 RepID=A0A2U2RPG4_9MICO|nr:hypothetical protein [Brachybacterium endophyticum]PWH07695.1 hypothetical protein DEO23_03475 [Brachybacterium endophyticum]